MMVVILFGSKKCGSKVKKLGPSLPARQGLTPPQCLQRGPWPSQIGTAWASALSSLPAADIRATRWAEQRSAGDIEEGDSVGGGE